jgi:uncharacterized protein YjiK
MKSRLPTFSFLLATTFPVAAVEPLNRYTSITSYTIDVSEASGVSYNWDSRTLFAIGDEGTALVELTKTGATLGTMDFDYNRTPREARAIDDAEGVAYLGNNTFMIADERRNQGVVTLYEEGAFRTLQDLTPTTYSFGPYDGNTGLEGVCYDPIENAFWGVKELGPVRIYRMTGVSTGSPVVTQPIITKYISRLQTNLGIAQLSDIYALSACPAFANSPRRPNLLLLARESNLVVEINRTGEIIDSVSIGSIGRHTVEGIVLDEAGTIYLVSEGSPSEPPESPLKNSALHVMTPPVPPFNITSHGYTFSGEQITAELTWGSIAGASYRIEYSAGPTGDWQEASDIMVASGTTTTGATHPLPDAGKGFFRVKKIEH